MTGARLTYLRCAIAAVALAAIVLMTGCIEVAGPREDSDSIAITTDDSEVGWWTRTTDNTAERPREPEVVAPATIVIPADVLFFGFDSADIGADGEELLDRIAPLLIEAGTPVTVVGHTDDTGTDSYNLDLGAARAKAVTSALTERGVPPELLLGPVSVGEACPLAQDRTSAARARNRRVELVPAPEFTGAAAPTLSEPGL